MKETLLFEKLSIILFLNKEYLFEEKYKLRSIKVCFDDYIEGEKEESSSRAKEFIARKFIECDKSMTMSQRQAILNSNSADSSTSSDSSVSDVDGTRLKRRDIYWHYTFALDRKNIETVVASVKDKILKYMLESMRL